MVTQREGLLANQALINTLRTIAVLNYCSVKADSNNYCTLVLTLGSCYI